VGRPFICQDETAYIQFLIQPCNGIRTSNLIDLGDGETLSEILYMCQQKKYGPICTEKEKERISPKTFPGAYGKPERAKLILQVAASSEQDPLPSGIFV
jgi:hypothetical protein